MNQSQISYLEESFPDEAETPELNPAARLNLAQVKRNNWDYGQ